MLLSELSLKDVVNDQDGSKIGKVTDLEIDALTGKILNVKNRILKIGSYVIIIDNQTKIDKEDKN